MNMGWTPSDMLIFFRSLNTFFGIWRIRGPLADRFASPPNPQGPEPPGRREKPSHRDPSHPSPALLPQFFPARYRHFPVTPSLDLGVPASQRSARGGRRWQPSKNTWTSWFFQKYRKTTKNQTELDISILPKNSTRHAKKSGRNVPMGEKKKYKFCCARIDSFEDRFYTIILLLLNNLWPKNLTKKKTSRRLFVNQVTCNSCNVSSDASENQLYPKVSDCKRRSGPSSCSIWATAASISPQWIKFSSENPHNSGGFSPPLWKMMEWKSVGMMKFPIWWESHKIPWFQTTNQNLLVSFALQICLPAQENTS